MLESITEVAPDGGCWEGSCAGLQRLHSGFQGQPLLQCCLPPLAPDHGPVLVAIADNRILCRWGVHHPLQTQYCRPIISPDQANFLGKRWLDLLEDGYLIIDCAVNILFHSIQDLL